MMKPCHYTWQQINKVGHRATLLQTRSNTSCHKDEAPYNNILRPIAFASNSLTDTEKLYSNIEREALSILYGLKNSAITASQER